MKQLYEKLGLTNETVAAVVNPPDDYFTVLGGTVGMQKEYPSLSAGRFDLIHLYVNNKEELETLLKESVYSVSPWGMVWVSWQKKDKYAKTDVNEDMIRKVALPLGLVDVKVASVDDTWSALKLVFRRKGGATLF
jgi:hypothetical protein